MTAPHRQVGPAAALLALAAGLLGCSADVGASRSSTTSTTATAVSGSAPTLTSATLTDDADATAGTWSTTWEACFAPAGDEQAASWQKQTMTSEGSSPGVDEMPGGCVELQVATGVGTPEDDPTRTSALSDAARLVYRMRVVRTDGTVTPWSVPVAAGTTG